jgi:hypothetical protein
MKFKVWLGLGALTILLALATALILMFVRSQAAPSSTTGLPEVGGAQTAQQAYQVLQQWAPGWADDVQLISVAASMLKTEGQGLGWSFQVYSPTRQRLAVVLVTPDKVWVLREKTLPYPQRPIAQPDWKFDSDAALAKWWQEGGAALWTQRGVESLYVHLRNEKNGVLVWQLNLLDKDGELVGYWGISAADGAVLYEGVPGGKP